MQRKKLGSLGENLTCQYLQHKGYLILEHNFSSRFGEIDIIVIDGKDLVFVEVKTRYGNSFGLPEEAVTARKIIHLKRVGYYYQNQHPKLPKSLRIDVVAINLFPTGELNKIALFKNITLV